MSKKLDKLRREAATSPWPKRLKRMKSYQDENSKTWARNEKLLFGKSGENTPSADKDPARQNALAYGWGLVKSLETLVYVQDPDMIVDAIDQSRREIAEIVTKVCCFDIDQMDVKSAGNLCLTDTFVYGYGTVIEDVKTERDEDGGIVDQDYSVRRIHPRDFLPDPRGLLVDLSDHRYIALAFYPTIGELKEDPLFADNLPSDDELRNFPETFQSTRSDSPGQYVVRDPMGGKGEEDGDYKTICVWEVHDGIGGKIHYLTDKDYLQIGEEEAPVSLRLRSRRLYPVTVMALNKSTTGWYPIPELDLVATQLTALNQIQAMIQQDSVTKWRKWVAPAPLISETQAAQITDTQTAQSVIRIEMDDIGEVVQASHMHELDLRKLVVGLDDISLQRDLPLVKEMLEQDIAKILGYGPIDRGGLPKTRSAREAMAIKEKMEQRLVKRADAVADFYRLLGTKHIQFLQQTMDVKRYAAVYSDARKLVNWVTYGRDQIAALGEFAFTVYSGTSGPKTTEAKRASEEQLFRTGTQVAIAAGLPLEPFFYRLAKYYQWDGVDELFRNHKGALKQLAAVLAAMQTQQVPPVALLNSASQAVQTGLSPNELSEIARAIQGGAAGGGAPPAGPVGERGDPGGNRAISGAM